MCAASSGHKLVPQYIEIFKFLHLHCVAFSPGPRACSQIQSYTVICIAMHLQPPQLHVHDTALAKGARPRCSTR
jgi:hypothetical protein